jgi:hypothetical protein
VVDGLFSNLRTFRMAAVIFAITALLCVSAASVSAAHAHPNKPDDTCNVCSTAHMAARHVAVIQLVHAPELQSILPPPVAIQTQESGRILSTLTRGPPSLL